MHMTLGLIFQNLATYIYGCLFFYNSLIFNPILPNPSPSSQQFSTHSSKQFL